MGSNFHYVFLIEASWYLDDWAESVFQSMRSENYFSEPRKSFYFIFLNKIFKFYPQGMGRVWWFCLFFELLSLFLLEQFIDVHSVSILSNPLHPL